MAANQPTAEAPDSVFSQAGAGAAWHSGAAMRAQSFGPATDLMMDLAGLKPGDRVLDVAAGTGDTSIVAARGLRRPAMSLIARTCVPSFTSAPARST